MTFTGVRRRVGLGLRPTAASGALATVLEDNQRRLVVSLGARLRAFEARYELQSASVRDALADGRLRDTEDVCEWVVAWEAYRAATAGPARME